MEQINFQVAVDRLKQAGFNPLPDRVRIMIPNAKEQLINGLRYFEGDNAKWLPEYEEIVK